MLDLRGHASAVEIFLISDIVLRGLPVGLNCMEQFEFRVRRNSGELIERRFSDSVSRPSGSIIFRGSLEDYRVEDGMLCLASRLLR